MGVRGQKALLGRQQKIAANQKAWEQSQAQALADHEAGKPQDWKTAYKNAGGNNTAVWSTVGSSLGGGILGGGIDASMGNDSWTDGATVGAGLGAVAGVGGFARSVHKLKVGSMTQTVEPAGGLSSEALSRQQTLAQRNMRDEVSARRKPFNGVNYKLEGKPYDTSEPTRAPRPLLALPAPLDNNREKLKRSL